MIMVNNNVLVNKTDPKLVLRLIKAKGVLENNFYTKVDMNSLAKEIFLSKFYFCRSFKSVFGITPHQYVLNKRLERSVELITEGKWMITDIAYMVGFADVYSFSKSFKKRYNACPTKFSATHVSECNSANFF